ncbi:MAG: SIMPL domain-containing protein [Planctomycetes bacterium]|nr:SIMPL domain-containing protein [Planctomycetota bacterium]
MNRLRLLGLSLLLLGFGGWPVHADDGGITVSGTGEVKGKPTSVEFELRTGGTAELTGDAIVKYRDTKRRTLEAFQKLKLKNLQLEEKGVGLASAGGAAQQAVFVQPGAAPAVKPQVEIARTVRVVLRDIQGLSEEELMDTIAKILDTARDSGGTIGGASDTATSLLARMYGQQMSSPMATFVLDNATELREQAYGQAMQEARARANRLATLANVKLGPVLSVQEQQIVSAGDTNPQVQMMLAIYGIRDSSGKDDLRLTSDKFAEIPVRVSLQVRFGIEKRE